MHIKHSAVQHEKPELQQGKYCIRVCLVILRYIFSVLTLTSDVLLFFFLMFFNFFFVCFFFPPSPMTMTTCLLSSTNLKFGEILGNSAAVQLELLH